MSRNDSANLEGVSADDRELLAHLLHEEGGGALAGARISPRDDRSDAPLSFSQRPLWAVDRLRRSWAVWNSTAGARMSDTQIASGFRTFFMKRVPRP